MGQSMNYYFNRPLTTLIIMQSTEIIERINTNLYDNINVWSSGKSLQEIMQKENNNWIVDVTNKKTLKSIVPLEF